MDWNTFRASRLGFLVIAALIFAVSANQSSQAFAGPATLKFYAEILNFFATLNDLRKYGADPTSMAVGQTREMVVAMHGRMNALSEASNEILSELSGFPEVMREEIRTGITLEHVREVEGLVDLIETDVALLIQGKTLPVPLGMRLSALQNRRGALMRGGRTGLPILATGLALEEFLLWEARVDGATIAAYRRSYLDRFQQALDIDMNDSLASSYYYRQMELDGWCVNGRRESGGLCDSTCFDCPTSCDGGGCLGERGLQDRLDGVEQAFLHISKVARETYYEWVAERKSGRTGIDAASRIFALDAMLGSKSTFETTGLPDWAVPPGLGYHELKERDENAYRAQVYLAQSEAALIELLVEILQMYGESVPQWYFGHNMAYGKGNSDFDILLVKPRGYSLFKGHTMYDPLMGPRSVYCRESATRFEWSHGESEPRYMSCYRRLKDEIFDLASNIGRNCVNCEVPNP